MHTCTRAPDRCDEPKRLSYSPANPFTVARERYGSLFSCPKELTHMQCRSAHHAPRPVCGSCNAAGRGSRSARSSYRCTHGGRHGAYCTGANTRGGGRTGANVARAQASTASTAPRGFTRRAASSGGPLSVACPGRAGTWGREDAALCRPARMHHPCIGISAVFCCHP